MIAESLFPYPTPQFPAALIFARAAAAAVRSERGALLWWIDVPPHGKRSYRFDEARWSFTD